MLIDILRFEWRYYTRQLSFGAAAVLFAGSGMVLAGTGFGAANIHVNSPYSIFESLGMASLASVFVVAIFCADALVRDRDRQMEEIVFTTAVGRFHFLFGRFAGSFLAAFTAFACCAAGMVAALALPQVDAQRIGPFHVVDYLWPMLVMVLPTMLIVATVLFAIAAFTRSILATVVGAVFIYVLYFVASALTGSPLMAGSSPGADHVPFASLLDPFALSAFFEQTRYWTPLQRNAQLVQCSGEFLLSRLLWLGAAAALWALVYRRFSFRQLRASRPVATAVASPRTATSTRYQSPTVSRGAAVNVRAFRFATAIELRESILTLPFALLTLLWMALCASEIVADITGGEYGSALYPATGLVMRSVQQPLTLIGIVTIVYFAAEICWRERTVGFAEVMNATPAPAAVAVLAKAAAVSAIPVVFVVTGSMTAMAVQLARGYAQVDVRQLFASAWFSAMPLVLFGALTVLVHTIVPHKYAGMILTLVLAMAIRRTDLVGLEHPLWRYGSGGEVPHSEMNGFGPFARAFNTWMLLWSAVAALLLLAAALLWRRAAGDRARGVFSTMRRGLTQSMRVAPAVFGSIAIATAVFLFYNTNIVNAYVARAAALDWRADYERTYAAAHDELLPAISAITATVDLDPTQRRMHVRGSYSLVNRGTRPLERLLVTMPAGDAVAVLSIPGASLESRDGRFATWRFRFARPLLPGAAATLLFDLRHVTRGLPADDDDTSIVANGSFVSATSAFPQLAYARSRELTRAADRRERGLPVREENAAGSEEDVPGNNPDWVTLDMTVTTDSDQIAVAPGQLVSVQHGARNAFRYRSDGTIRNVVVIASARYARSATNVEIGGHPVRVEILFDSRHRVNVPRMLAAATDALRLYSRTFGPYPHRELRIAEVPSYEAFGGFATPGLIFLNEDRAFLIDARDPSRLDLVTRRVAHEVAHQWWGHGVAPAEVEGSAAITESLAKYSELLMLATRYGRDATRESLARELDLYFSGRTGDERREVPLARATYQDYIYYRKGSVVFNGIADLIGAETFHRALRTFYETQHGPGHAPTSADLVAALHAVSSADQAARIDEWMNDILLYDMKLTSAQATQRGDGTWDVTLQVQAGRTRETNDGKSVPLPLNEEVNVGLFDGPPATATLLVEGKQTLHTGANTLHLTSASRPQVAAIDPWITRVERDRSDNVREVAAATGSGSATARK